jgi:hypothetical protein
VKVVNIGRFFKNVEHFCFAVLGLFQLSFELFERHHFFCLCFVEIENDKVIEL